MVRTKRIAIEIGIASILTAIMYAILCPEYVIILSGITGILSGGLIQHYWDKE